MIGLISNVHSAFYQNVTWKSVSAWRSRRAVLLYFMHIIFGYSSWRCPSQRYPVSIPEVSILQIRTKRWEYTAWRDIGAQWNSGGALTRHRPLWWNNHVMNVYMSSNSMKLISSQFWYLRSIPHHDPANHLHPEIPHLYTFMWCILCRCGMKG